MGLELVCAGGKESNQLVSFNYFNFPRCIHIHGPAMDHGQAAYSLQTWVLNVPKVGTTERSQVQGSFGPDLCISADDVKTNHLKLIWAHACRILSSHCYGMVDSTWFYPFVVNFQFRVLEVHFSLGNNYATTVFFQTSSKSWLRDRYLNQRSFCRRMVVVCGRFFGQVLHVNQVLVFHTFQLQQETSLPFENCWQFAVAFQLA